jgi:hypothetical protein
MAKLGIIALFGVLALAVWMAVASMRHFAGPIPTSGTVAMWLGIGFSLVVGIGLMGLVFYSSRKGYDEPARFDRD